jgi:nitroreductase
MLFEKPMTTIIQQRFSCRTYAPRPIARSERDRLLAFMSSDASCPFRTPARFMLIAAKHAHGDALKGLRTYGFIRGATGYILGAVEEGERNLEDFGYLMERIILFATSIGLGTCWLGGTFNRSGFASRMSLRRGETMPAVASVGYAAKQRRLVDRAIRLGAGADNRLPWEVLFFERSFEAPLSREAADRFALPLEMVRLGPSASNRQPWRIIKDDRTYHFYLQRSRAYRQRNARAFGIADMQRVDMGIAMCHFELTATELGLEGGWVLGEPDIGKADSATEYTASWVAAGAAL